MNLINPFLRIPLEDKLASSALLVVGAAGVSYFESSIARGVCGLLGTLGTLLFAANYFDQMNAASGSMAMDVQGLERAILEANENGTLQQKKAGFVGNYDTILRAISNLPRAQIPDHINAAFHRCKAHLTTSTPLEVRVNTLQGFNDDLEALARETIQAVERRTLPASKATLVQRFNTLLQMGYVLERIQPPQEVQNFKAMLIDLHRVLNTEVTATQTALPVPPLPIASRPAVPPPPAVPSRLIPPPPVVAPRPAPPARPAAPVLPSIPEHFIADLFHINPDAEKPETEADIPPAPLAADGTPLNPVQIFTDLIAELRTRGVLDGNTTDDDNSPLRARNFPTKLQTLVNTHQRTIGSRYDTDRSKKYAEMTIRIIHHFAHHFETLKKAIDRCTNAGQKRELQNAYTGKLNLFLQSCLPAFEHCNNRKSTVFEDLYAEMIERSSDHYERQTFPKKLAIALQEFRKHLLAEAINRVNPNDPHMVTTHKWYRKQPLVCDICKIPMPRLSSLDDDHDNLANRGHEEEILEYFISNNTPKRKLEFLRDVTTFAPGKPKFFTNDDLYNWMRENFDLENALDENTYAWRPQALLAMLHKLNFIIPDFA